MVALFSGILVNSGVLVEAGRLHSSKGTYFIYVRTIGGRGGRQNAYKCVQRGGGCHPYAYVRNFS